MISLGATMSRLGRAWGDPPGCSGNVRGAPAGVALDPPSLPSICPGTSRSAKEHSPSATKGLSGSPGVPNRVRTAGHLPELFSVLDMPRVPLAGCAIERYQPHRPKGRRSPLSGTLGTPSLQYFPTSGYCMNTRVFFSLLPLTPGGGEQGEKHFSAPIQTERERETKRGAGS